VSETKAWVFVDLYVSCAASIQSPNLNLRSPGILGYSIDGKLAWRALAATARTCEFRSGRRQLGTVRHEQRASKMKQDLANNDQCRDPMANRCASAVDLRTRRETGQLAKLTFCAGGLSRTFFRAR
jgi:hypothetical protein